MTYEGGMFLIGFAENTPCEWLIDTGCTTTLLSTRIFEKMTPDERPELQEYTGTLLSADGSTIKTLGLIELNIKLGLQDFRQRCIVCDITNDGLIGLDFLKNHNVGINFGKQKVVCKNENLPVKCRVGQTKTCRVYLAENTVIPASSRTIVQAKSSQPLATGDWISEPLNHSPGNEPVLVAKTLFKGCGTNLPIEILNPTDSNVYLYKNTNLGITTRIHEEDVACISTSKEVQQAHLTTEEARRQQEELPEEMVQMMNRIDINLSKEEFLKVKILLQKHRDVFACTGEELGRTKLTKHSIKTEVDHPIKQHVRRPPFHLRDEAEKEVKKMLDNDIIETSESPWASPVVLVRKKDGSLRYCIDYRKLNAITIKDSYPLPRIDESLDSLGGSRYFSTLDLASGYWQIELDEDAKQKSAFCTTSGLFQFKVMPFGLTNAPATFQRLMERVLSSLQWQICLVYIDDVIIFSKTLDEHIDRLQEILGRLKTAGLKLKPKKCHLFQHKVTYLGHMVSENGVETDPAKIEKVKKWPIPKNITEVKGFLGICSYYRRFVKNFSILARPLVKLTEKDTPFLWKEEQQGAFDLLKEKLTSSPILVYPQRQGYFILDTDACDTGIGAVLSQIQDGQEKVIAYASRTLNKAERKYCVTRKELLAVVYFSQYFKHFLLGRKFTVRTDHSSLRWIRNFKNPEGQIARWIEVLETFDFDIIHRPGIRHGNADAMSRIPCKQCGMNDHTGEKVRPGRKNQGHGLNPPDKLIPPIEKSKVMQSHQGMPAVDSPSVPVANQSNGFLKPASPLDNVLSNQRASLRKAATPLANSQTHSCPADCNKTSFQNALPVRTRSKVTPAIQQGSNWMTSADFDLQTFKVQQDHDPVTAEVKTWVEQGHRPTFENISFTGVEVKFLWGQFDSLCIQNSLLVRKLESEFSKKCQVYVPTSLRGQVLEECHSSKTSSHLGRRKSFFRLKQKFIWPGMRRDMDDFVSTCQICQSFKVAQKKRRGPQKPFPVGLPLERVCIDIVGPFPVTKNGNKYILVVTDCFTKFVEAYPMPNIEAKTTAEILVKEFITRYGTPLHIHTDQGTQFEAELFQTMCQILGIQKTRTTPFRPQSDGQSERNIRTITNLLAMAVKKQDEWDEFLPFVLMAYRATPHETTEFTPNLMMFGRENNIPVDILLPPSPDDKEMKTPEKYASELKKKLNTAYEMARTHLKKTAERQKRLYDQKTFGHKFNKGDIVWMANLGARRKGVSPKFQPKWKGPYLIVQKFNEVLVEIMKSHSKTSVVHTDHLKEWRGKKIPKWLLKIKKQMA